MTACETGTGLSANIKAEPSLFGTQTKGATSTRRNKAGHGLAEGETWAVLGQTEEAASVQQKGDRDVEHG
ncbi:MAG: hypothetical protein OHK0022_21840 [Roseiflexaceae bacterium]